MGAYGDTTTCQAFDIDVPNGETITKITFDYLSQRVIKATVEASTPEKSIVVGRTINNPQLQTQEYDFTDTELVGFQGTGSGTAVNSITPILLERGCTIASASSGGDDSGSGGNTNSADDDEGISGGAVAAIIIIVVCGLFMIPAVYFICKCAQRAGAKDSNTVVPTTERSAKDIEVADQGKVNNYDGVPTHTEGEQHLEDHKYQDHPTDHDMPTTGGILKNK